MKKLLTIFAFPLLLLACSDNKEENGNGNSGSITIETETVFFDSDGSTMPGYENSIVVNSDGKWEVVGKEDWSHLSSTSGESGATVTFTADENNTGKSREQKYIFVSRSATTEVLVKQYGRSLELGQDYFEFTYQGGSVATTISSEEDISDYTIDVEWLSTSDINSSTIWFTITVDAYDGLTDREGKIIFFEGTADEKVITVYQTSKPTLTYNGEAAFTDDLSARDYTVRFTTNRVDNYTVTSNSSWLTYTVESTNLVEGTIYDVTLKVSAESALTSRSGTITIRDEANSVVITVNQVDPDEVMVANIASNYFRVDWTQDMSELTEVTFEAMLWLNSATQSIITFMGVENVYLVRLGDTFSRGQIQVVKGESGKYPTVSSDRTTFPTGDWHHLAITHSADNSIKIYLDGVLQSTSAAVSGKIDLNGVFEGTTNNPFYIGYSYSSGREWPGRIAEARVWTVARTQQEIEDNMYGLSNISSAGLAAYWKFNEGSGNTIADHSGNGNDITSNSNLSWVSSSVPWTW